MEILLINPRITKEKSIPVFPLGLGYIAAVLQDAGHKVEVLDVNAIQGNRTEVEQRIKESNFDLAGITGLITHFNQVKQLSALLKKHSSAKIMLGGGLATAVPDIVLEETDVDIAAIGESENTVLELVAALEMGRQLSTVSGLYYKEDGVVASNQPRKLIADISQLPFPAWDLFPMDYYVHTPTASFQIPKMDVITARGCPYQCTFCYHGIFGHRVRIRKVENILEEIVTLKKRYGVKGIVFQEDTFVLEKKHTHELCDRLIEEKVGIQWICSSRVNLVDEAVLRKMKAAGCAHVLYGVESGSQHIVDRIKKGITVERSRKAIALSWRVGLCPAAFMMIGLPGETRESIEDSVAFCQETGVTANFSIATPIPGTSLYNEAVKMGRVKDKKELVARWGDYMTNVVVNLTEIPDQQLIEMKEDAERRVLIHILTRQPYLMIKWLITDMKVNGILNLLRRLCRGIKRIVLMGLIRRGDRLTSLLKARPVSKVLE